MEYIEIKLPLASNCKPLRLNSIPAGRFTMGDKESRGLDDVYDTPVGEFEVIVTRDYWIGVYPVTQCQWQSIMGNNPSNFIGNNAPVEMVSWHDAMNFCEVLNSKYLPEFGLPEHYRFSLPTEAQWEYACRAGTTYKYQIGDDLDDLSRMAWHRKNIEDRRTCDVGLKHANHFGLYDMLGNVMEWCFDSPSDYPDRTVQTDWIGKGNGRFHSLRGGCFLSDPLDYTITCSGRTYGFESNWFWGFRVCLRYHPR